MLVVEVRRHHCKTTKEGRKGGTKGGREEGRQGGRRQLTLKSNNPHLAGGDKPRQVNQLPNHLLHTLLHLLTNWPQWDPIVYYCKSRHSKGKSTMNQASDSTFAITQILPVPRWDQRDNFQVAPINWSCSTRILWLPLHHHENSIQI